MGIEFEPIWFDSLGAKSSCTLVRTPDVAILIDPGCAVMQPSYPLPEEEKLSLLEEAFHSIARAAAEADRIVITHYHYDHFLTIPEIYAEKPVWLKDPNRWINRSQWARAREFLALLANYRGGSLLPKEPEDNPALDEDPFGRLEIARTKGFGSYQRRRAELLARGRERLLKLRQLWLKGPWVEEEALKRVGIEFADGRAFKMGETTVRFTEPLFHGIEYANTGWVIAVIVEHGGAKLIYSSDLEGPTIEDYAEWIISERPNYLILDGPSTYLLGYMLNMTNLNRAIENAKRIARECEPRLEVMIFDHHLLRDRRYRERTAEVWAASPKVVTAAEFLGRKPLLDQMSKLSH
jgi:hypothetical protein